MRRQTLRIVNTRRESISFKTTGRRLHCMSCGHLVETIGTAELVALHSLTGKKGSPHFIATADGTRICRDSITSSEE